jgi:hypothetical protein
MRKSMKISSVVGITAGFAAFGLEALFGLAAQLATDVLGDTY